MSDDEDSVSSSDMEFNPWVVGHRHSLTYLREMEDLQHVPGEELHQVLPEGFTSLVFEGNASREYKEYERVLYLLQSSRRWECIGLADNGPTRATPEFLSLVVLALTKTKRVSLNDCPFDENLFACLNSGMQTLTHVKMINSSVRISHSAAAIFANGLALSNSIVRLEIQEPCWFEPGAALKLVEGIKRNKSLEDLTVAEVNMGKVAMISLLRALAEGQHPKLVTLNINLKLESDCATFVTKLMSSDACHVKDLTVDANRYSPNMFRTDGIQMGKPNMKLKSLHVSFPLLEESYLTMLLPMMAGLLHLRLRFCEITDLSPVIDHLCRPNTSIKSIDLGHNKMGIDQVEKFVGSLADMHSLTDVDFTENTWSYDRSVDEERVKNIVQKVSNCFNLEKFVIRGERGWKQDVKNLNLNLAINRAWRRELCYNNKSPPSKLLPFIITRALRKTERDRHGDVVLALLRERMSDLIPVPPSD